MMSDDGTFYSEEYEVEIENRGGAGFGKVYIFWPGTTDLEAVMLWSMWTGISESDARVTSVEQRHRAIMAMTECPWTQEMLAKVYQMECADDEVQANVEDVTPENVSFT